MRRGRPDIGCLLHFADVALVAGKWIDEHDNLIICGPTGVGKSWLACALGHKACRDHRSVLYQRTNKLFADLALARGDGQYARVCRALFGVQLLILDDFALEPIDPQARHDLLEIVEERYGRKSTIFTRQIPVDQWHTTIGDPTYADATLDRIARAKALSEGGQITEAPPIRATSCRNRWATSPECASGGSAQRGPA